MTNSPKKMTLSDVAKLAGVSSGAVSKVLNGGSGRIGVGAEARKRILEAARKLNYKANMAASILAGGDSKLIGVFIDSFASYRRLRLLQEIERLCTKAGYRIITSFSHDNIAAMKEDFLTLQRYGVRGFICCAHDYPELKKEVVGLFAGAENVVCMEKPFIPGVPYVRTSRRKALTEMIADASRAGYRRIGLLHGRLAYSSEKNLRSEFESAMRSNGLPVDPNLIFEYPEGPEDPKIRIRAAMENMILPFRPDFLYVDDAPHAAALRTKMLLSGRDIMIHGGNGDPLFDDIELRTFDPGYEKMAEALLDLLLRPENRKKVPVIEAVYKNIAKNSSNEAKANINRRRKP